MQTAVTTIGRIREIIPELKITSEWKNLNYKRIPVTKIDAKIGNEKLWNNVVGIIKDAGTFQAIERTNSHGVSINNYNRWRFHQYDIRQQGACVELTVCDIEGCFRLQWRVGNYKTTKEGSEEEKLISATQYFKKFFKPACEKFGVNMSDYVIADGEEVNKQIHKYDVDIYDIQASWQMELQGVNHLDFHKFFPSGLIESHPEFRPVVESLLAGPEGKDFHKAGLASVIGYFHSWHCNYKWAGLARDAINTAYKKFDEVKAIISDRIVATNTDGIWYRGKPFHGIYESEDLGGWSNDYINCLIRFKSKGAYEFICDGKYKAVVRGQTLLDKVLPREQWQPGDIFKNAAELILWTLDKESGEIKWRL